MLLSNWLSNVPAILS